jgi:hypothetical protein
MYYPGLPEYIDLPAARPSLQQLFVDVTDTATRNEQIYQAVRVHLNGVLPWLRSTLAVCFHPDSCFPLCPLRPLRLNVLVFAGRKPYK